jgi:UDP-3-O-[3-hydroxymyristoyl] N-acetylglucosamine deacetylase
VSQYTLEHDVRFDGVGLHTGQSCHIRVLPAEVGTGIRFTCGGETFVANADSVVSTRRAVTLGNDRIRVSTVEHLLASLRAFHIDNALVEVDGPEIPVLDGSAASFVEGLTSAGRKRQAGKVPVIMLTSPVWVSEGDMMLLALPGPSFRLTYVGGFPGIANQSISRRITPGVFAKEIAPARTVAFREEVEALLAQGLGQGGTLDTVVILDKDGPCGPTRFADEPLRHKMLDLIGDLSLLGHRLQAHVIAIRSGHRLNLELVKEMRKREEIS